MGKEEVPGLFFFKVPYQTFFFLWFPEAMKWANSHFSKRSAKIGKAKEDAGE